MSGKSEVKWGSQDWLRSRNWMEVRSGWGTRNWCCHCSHLHSIALQLKSSFARTIIWSSTIIRHYSRWHSRNALQLFEYVRRIYLMWSRRHINQEHREIRETSLTRLDFAKNTQTWRDYVFYSTSNFEEGNRIRECIVSKCEFTRRLNCIFISEEQNIEFWRFKFISNWCDNHS